jgi:hypothetical protein
VWQQVDISTTAWKGPPDHSWEKALMLYVSVCELDVGVRGESICEIELESECKRDWCIKRRKKAEI